nr:MAG TPA: hypothetical protein [Caudoviricetes sp.]
MTFSREYSKKGASKAVHPFCFPASKPNSYILQVHKSWSCPCHDRQRTPQILPRE